jgi:hypothetical protein
VVHALSWPDPPPPSTDWSCHTGWSQEARQTPPGNKSRSRLHNVHTSDVSSFDSDWINSITWFWTPTLCTFLFYCCLFESYSILRTITERTHIRALDKCMSNVVKLHQWWVKCVCARACVRACIMCLFTFDLKMHFDKVPVNSVDDRHQ